MSLVSLVTSKDYDKLEEESQEEGQPQQTGETCSSGLRAEEIYGAANGSLLASLLRDCSGYYRSVLNPTESTRKTENAAPAGVDATPNNRPVAATAASTPAPAQSSSNDSSNNESSEEHGNDEAASFDGADNGSNYDGRSQSSSRSFLLASSTRSDNSARSETGSCTSSMTGNSGDGNNHEDGDGAGTSSDNAMSSPSSSTSFVRMGDALSTSKLPRYVIEREMGLKDPTCLLRNLAFVFVNLSPSV
jgi:hypothetical protein